MSRSTPPWRGHLGAWIGSCEFYDSADEHGAPGTCRWSLGGSGATPVAKELIPPDATHPGARSVGIGGPLAAAVLRARPDLGPGLRRALALEGAPTAALDRLAASDAEARRALETVVAGGYYMSPEACKAVGYPGLPGHPGPYPAYIADGLLDHLLTDDE